MKILLLILAALGWNGVLGAAREIDCYGSLVKIDLLPNGAPTPSADLKIPPAVYGLPSLFGTPLNETSLGPLPLYTAEPGDACSEVTSPAIAGGAAGLVHRGNCSFTTKALNLQFAGFSTMLLYDNDASDSCIVMSGNDTAEAGEVHLIGVSITASAAGILKTLAAHQGSIMVTQPPLPGPFDPAEAVLWGIAVATVLGGGLWAGSAVNTGRHERQGRAFQADHDQTDENAVITARAAASFIFVASAALVGLYFFLSEWLAVILTLLFAFIAWQSTAVVLGSLFRAISPPATRTTVVTLPWGDKTPMLAVDLLGALLAAGITVTWLAVRHHTHWSWILQDILSLCLMLFILRSIHLPNLQVACILLPAALLYDVWWVFIQPRVTGGPSVMVAVAAGGFDLPMLLAVPQWYGLGSNPGLTILGLGDVVLPGLLVAFSRRWDVAVAHAIDARQSRPRQREVSHSHGSYFLPLVAAYGAGLLITFIALALGVGGGQGQPALLYLVPCTLGTMLALGWWRGEVMALWKGDYVMCRTELESGRDEEEANSSLLNRNGGDEIEEGPPTP